MILMQTKLEWYDTVFPLHNVLVTDQYLKFLDLSPRDGHRSLQHGACSRWCTAGRLHSPSCANSLGKGTCLILAFAPRNIQYFNTRPVKPEEKWPIQQALNPTRMRLCPGLA